MCLLWSTNWVFISQKTPFFIVTAVKTSNLTYTLHDVLRVYTSDKQRIIVIAYAKQYFIECEYSLPCSQDSSIGPYYEPHESGARLFIRFWSNICHSFSFEIVASWCRLRCMQDMLTCQMISINVQLYTVNLHCLVNRRFVWFRNCYRRKLEAAPKQLEIQFRCAYSRVWRSEHYECKMAPTVGRKPIASGFNGWRHQWRTSLCNDVRFTGYLGSRRQYMTFVNNGFNSIRSAWSLLTTEIVDCIREVCIRRKLASLPS
jgi:hypothetical protein